VKTNVDNKTVIDSWGFELSCKQAIIQQKHIQ